MWGNKVFLSTEPPLVSSISSRAAKAAEEKFDLILFQSLVVSMDTRWTSSRAVVAEFITARPSQRRVAFPTSRSQCQSPREKQPRDTHAMSSSSTQAIDALEAQVNLISSLPKRTVYNRRNLATDPKTEMVERRPTLKALRC